jgi:cobalt-zinc-cadmium efflux system protein
MFNSFGLVGLSVVVVWQAFERMLSPAPVVAVVPAIVGLLAALANGCVALLLRRVGHMNPAIRLAYLHNLGDIYVSLAPVAAGVLVWLTGLIIIDPIVALLTAAWIIFTTIKEIRGIGDELLWPQDAVCVHEEEAQAASFA